MEFTTELCLAPSRNHHHVKSSTEYSSESESHNNNVGTNDHNSTRKRKMMTTTMMGSPHDHHRNHVVDLHHLDQEVKNDNNSNKKPLPLDWEQCLDLHSGMMYYFNRKTSRKSWDWPKEDTTSSHHGNNDHRDRNDRQMNKKTLDLELNISSSNKYNNNVNDDQDHHHHDREDEANNHHNHRHHQQQHMKVQHHQILATPSPSSEEGDFSTTTTSDGISSSTNEKDNNNMVALACLNCHLLVILSKSSPCCPNCKYVHSLQPTIFHHGYYPTQPNKAHFPPKPISTLSLLN